MSCELVLAAEHPIPRQESRTSEHIHLRAEPTAPRAARDFVSAHAPALDQDQMMSLLMLTSELVTNAVLHARSALTVGITVSETQILVTVADQVEARPEGRSYSDRRESGRGIVLVGALADDWGVVPEPDRPGKSVWFSMRRYVGSVAESRWAVDEMSNVGPARGEGA
jgi:two-component sensor histidine kinase